MAREVGRVPSLRFPPGNARKGATGQADEKHGVHGLQAELDAKAGNQARDGTPGATNREGWPLMRNKEFPGGRIHFPGLLVPTARRRGKNCRRRSLGWLCWRAFCFGGLAGFVFWGLFFLLIDRL